jgi:hypothetical protein
MSGLGQWIQRLRASVRLTAASSTRLRASVDVTDARNRQHGELSIENNLAERVLRAPIQLLM